MSTYNGPERRSSPRDRDEEITDLQVRGSTERTVRERIFVNDAKYTEGDKTKGLVRKELLRLVGAESATVEASSFQEPSAAETVKEFSLEAFARSQYADATAALKGDLYNPEKPRKEDISPLSMEEVFADLSNLTPIQIEAVKRMKKPRLELVPEGADQSRFVKNIDKGKRLPYQEDVVVSSSRKAQFKKDDKRTGAKGNITGWQVWIIEGEEELEGESGLLRDLVKEYEAKREEGVNVPTNNAQAILMADSIRRGSPVNKINWGVTRSEGRVNILKDQEDSLVSEVRWHADRPSFNEDNPDNLYRHACFRSAVMAKKT